jgi:hypothetical protein
MQPIRIAVAIIFIVVGVFLGLPPLPSVWAQEAPATPSDARELRIIVLEGEDAVNIVKKKTAVSPVVEVRDKNNLPVAGVMVVFALPDSGTGAAFAHGAKTLSVLTNSAGKAIVPGMKPLGTGTFKIGVTASMQGQTAAPVTMVQTNYLTLVAANAAGASSGVAAGVGSGAAAGGFSGLAIGGIIAGVAAAAVGIGVAVVAKGGGSNKAPVTTNSSGTIGLGGGLIFGPPH